MSSWQSRQGGSGALRIAAAVAALAVVAAAVILGCGENAPAGSHPGWLDIRLSATADVSQPA